MKDVGQRYRACEDESVALTRFGYSGAFMLYSRFRWGLIRVDRTGCGLVGHHWMDKNAMTSILGIHLMYKAITFGDSYNTWAPGAGNLCRTIVTLTRLPR